MQQTMDSGQFKRPDRFRYWNWPGICMTPAPRSIALKGAVERVSRKLGLEVSIWSNPTGIMISFKISAR